MPKSRDGGGLGRVAGKAAGRGTRNLLSILAVGSVLGAATASYPGMVRGVLLQPARDLLFFQRELQPLRHLGEIDREHPAPSYTSVLPAAGADSVDLAVDVWLPERASAPAVLLLHASSPRGRTLGFNRLLAARLQAAGWLVATPDLRGFGASGKPRDWTDPLQWRDEPDVLRVARHVLDHPVSDGRIVAVGHSRGGGVALGAAREDHPFLAVVAIGPARRDELRQPTVWQRARYSGNRRIHRLVPMAVVQNGMQHYSLARLALDLAHHADMVPVLLMDGEREGETLIRMLRDTATALGEAAAHITIPEAHHYCSAYQLPFGSTVYVRRPVFDRCADAVLNFIASVVW